MLGELIVFFPSLPQDLEYIEAGYYKLPWDMTTVTHRQFNPLFMFRR